MLAYLGRYTHRVAISNERLVALADGRVRFRWRDYADGHRVKVLDLDVDEFLRRFLLEPSPRYNPRTSYARGVWSNWFYPPCSTHDG